jgi:hypothetical protein
MGYLGSHNSKTVAGLEETDIPLESAGKAGLKPPYPIPISLTPEIPKSHVYCIMYGMFEIP